MKNLSTFQMIVFGICGALVVIGVLIFAAFNRAGSSSIGHVSIWGTLPQNSMDVLLGSLRTQDSSFQNVTYKQINPDSYDTTLLNAIASGQSPDLALISQEEVVAFADKLQLIPYTTVSKSKYQAAFVGEGDLFLAGQGIFAMPFVLDPLVMYWNKDLFSAGGVAEPPQYWDQMLTDTPELTVLTSSKDIQKSAIAMGQWDNVSDAKAILSALILQAGDPIVAFDPTAGKLTAPFGSQNGTIEAPAASALRFYTDFSDPSKSSYSWNRTLPLSQEAFAAGDLAVYIGFASEYPAIAARNPNLNFGAAVLPQPQGEPVPTTFGELTGLAIPRGAQNVAGAVKIAELLSADAGAQGIASSLGLPPVRRDLIKPVPNNAAQTAFMQSALIARGWLDPNPAATSDIFKTMVEWVLSGKYQPSDAVSQSALTLERLLPQSQ